MNVYRIKRLIYLSPIAKSPLIQYYRFKSNRGWIKAVAKDFGREGELDKIMPLIKQAYVRYRWNAEEFFLWKFETLSDDQRRAYCPEYDHNIFCLKVNDWKVARLFRNKWLTYQKFRVFYKRECVLLNSVADLQRKDIKLFFDRNSIFMAKPIGECCGHGIQKLTSSDEQLLRQMITTHGGGIMLEPYILQNSDISSLHPSSVNTLRIPVVNYGNKIELFHPCIRIGRGYSCVDNAAAGGLVALIDVKSGTIVDCADKHGKKYCNHPDTKVPLIGFKIPHWKQAVEKIRQIALEVPEIRYAGWDLALTDAGWVLIEGNEDGQFIFQYMIPGVAKEVKEILHKLNK